MDLIGRREVKHSCVVFDDCVDIVRSLSKQIVGLLMDLMVLCSFAIIFIEKNVYHLSYSSKCNFIFIFIIITVFVVALVIIIVIGK